MNKIVEKLNFKRIVVIYVIAFLLVFLTSSIVICVKYKDKIDFLYSYHKVTEYFEKASFDEEELKTKLDSISQTEDVFDVLLLDSKNNIMYSTNNNFSGTLVLTPLIDGSSSHNYYITSDGNILFKLLKKKELVLTTFFSDEYDKEYLDEDDELFYEDALNTALDIENKFSLSYSINEKTGDKLYFVLDVKPVLNGAIYIKTSLVILVFFFMLYWIILTFMIYQNALKVKLNPYFWGTLVLFTNIVGAIIYVMYKKYGIVCLRCSTYQSKKNIYCVNCGVKMQDVCKNCGSIILKRETYCSKCGEKRDK